MRVFAEKIAQEAGKLLLKLQSKTKVSKKKDAFGDIATTADLASEKLIISSIKKNYPTHNIFSEEIGLINKNSPYTWYIDPLDGTKEYARGLHSYAVLISCQTNENLAAACVYLPPINELFSAENNQGSWFNNQRLHVSTQDKLSHSFIYTRLPGNIVPEPEFSRSWQINQKIAKNVYKLRPANFEAEILCWVARGAADGMVMLGDYAPKWWDVAAAILIAQEAGATVTNRYGKPFKLGNLADGLVVTNGHIHKKLIDLINA